MLTVAAGNWRNVAAEMTVVVTAIHPIPNWGHLLATTQMNIVVTIEMTVRAVHGRATGPAVEVHMDQALHFQPQQWTCEAHLRAGGASGPGKAPGELLIAPWSLIRQPPIPKSNSKF